MFLSEVQCTGSESHITLCLSAGLGEQSCTLERSAGVFCDTRGEAELVFNHSLLTSSENAGTPSLSANYTYGNLKV